MLKTITKTDIISEAGIQALINSAYRGQLILRSNRGRVENRWKPLMSGGFVCDIYRDGVMIGEIDQTAGITEADLRLIIQRHFKEIN